MKVPVSQRRHTGEALTDQTDPGGLLWTLFKRKDQAEELGHDLQMSGCEKKLETLRALEALEGRVAHQGRSVLVGGREKGT